MKPYFLLLGLICINFSICEVASGAEEHQHMPMEKVGSLSFDEILNNAVVNAPEYIEGAVRENQAQAYEKVGRSLISARPVLALSYFGDSLQNNIGQTEYEYGIQLPLWRLGEKAGAKAQGQHYLEQSEAWLSYLTISIAGKLRSNLFSMQAAEAILDFEERNVSYSEQLLDIALALFEVGDLNRFDVLQAESLLLEAKRNELNAEAKLIDQERAYQTLTGLNVRPNYHHTEVLSVNQSIDASHPQLSYLQSSIAVAADKVKSTKRQAKGNPILSIGARRDRGVRADEYVDSIGIGFSLPIGGKTFVTSKVSDSQMDMVQMEVLYKTAVRQLEQQLHEAEHELLVTKQALLFSEEQNKISLLRWNMAKTAFELGEVNLGEVIIALQQFHSSEKELELLKIEVEQLVAESNQIIGELP